MSKLESVNPEGAERLPLKAFSEKAYLDYSMYVILDRALPNIGDGLKPVQRRIVYAMSELGLKAGQKYKKSARTVGDVLGKFHPHGDSACYEAMVLMAQPFSYRYPLVDGQGNWGSIDDPKSFAAMRYTESRLAKYAEVLLRELDQGTVDWVPNFDGTLEEPSLLPARLPNVLLNGATGIAVGMATDIPPHNLREVANACVHLIENPDASVTDLCSYIKGPDYPTEAEIITPKKDIREMYRQGSGSIRMRARYGVEDGCIVIHALPHQTSGSKILEQIAQQMNAKKLPMVEDLRDESDHENPTRLVIVPRSNRVDLDELMSHLFATTDLERTYRVNLNLIGINGRPQVKDLREILSEWLEFRIQTVRRRLQWRLDKVNSRLHILDGLLIAYLNIDEVIKIIRTNDEPKPVLMKRFKLSDTQAEAILELKLRHLAKLEEMQIRTEQKELADEKADLESILNSKARLRTLVKNEIKQDADTYGDDRCSPIIAREEAKAIDETALIGSDPVTIILSEKGWVRAAKGYDIDPTTLQYKSGDSYRAMAYGKNNQSAVFFDSTGRAYTLPAHTLPSARGHGDPLTTWLNPPSGATFGGVLLGTSDQWCLLASDAGYGFVAKMEELYTKNRNGKGVLSVPQGCRVVAPAPITDLETDLLVAITNDGHMLAFPVRDLPILAKGRGNKIVQVNPKDDELLHTLLSVPPGRGITVFAGKQHTTISASDLKGYVSERGRRGRKLPRGYQKVDRAIIQSSD